MKNELKFAFIRDIPVMLGYITMGIAFGLMIEDIGYNFVWAFFMSLFIFAGTMQFVLVSILSGGMNIFTTIVMTFSINSRHVFYGLSFLTKFREMGKAYPYMIFSLTDETYALLCGVKIPSTLNENKTMFYMAALNHSYWVLGGVMGAAIGQLITFDITGVDFAMTALFVVIAVEQWIDAKSSLPAIVGLGCGFVSLLVIGPDNFIIPAMLAAVAALFILKNPIEKKEADDGGAK